MPHLPQLSRQEADHWIQAALAEARALRQHDTRLYPLKPDAAALSTATALHQAWKAWAENAEAILRRLPGAAGASSAGEELRTAIAHAHALAGISPQEALRRVRAVEGGQAKLFTTEEARRELGIAPRR
jgi:hypothetical protein